MNLSTFPAINETFANPINDDIIKVMHQFKIFMLVLYSLLFIVGVPGNALVILTICRVKKMRTVNNLFIANLACGDIVNILWCCPTTAVSLFISWPYGEEVCKYIFTLTDVIIGNTVFTMVCITLDRYRVIVKPFARKLRMKETILIIIASWIACYSLIGLPISFVIRVTYGYWVKHSCHVIWPSTIYKQLYRSEQIILLFAIPSAVIIFCFVIIKRKLNANIRFASTTIRGRDKMKRAFRNQRIIKMLLVLILSFMLCFLPVIILCTMDLFEVAVINNWIYVGILFQISLALIFLNSTMNPIILYILSKDYRLGYLQQLKCFCPDSKHLNRAIQNLVRVTYVFGSIRKQKWSLNVVDETGDDNVVCKLTKKTMTVKSQDTDSSTLL